MAISQDFVSELRKHFHGDIRLDTASKALYSTDASIYQIEPLGVVLPRVQDDLIAIVELAAKFKVPILPRGSGSSLAGQAIGPALIVDCSKYLDHILEIDVAASTAKLEPGVILATLNRAVAKHGLMFGPDPASAERATVGGVIGNNATGAHSIIYGMTADHIASAEVILADGSLENWGYVSDVPRLQANRQSSILNEVIGIRKNCDIAIRQNWPKTWRNSAGYRLNYLLPWSPSRPAQWIGENYPPNSDSSMFNLAALLAGSEGTLAVIRNATLKLVRKPQKTILGILSYNSIVEACEAVPNLLKAAPSAVELVPQLLIRLARSVPAYANQLNFIVGDPAALLVVEFSGDDLPFLREKINSLRDDVLIAESVVDQANVWAVRKVGLGLFDSRPASARPVAFIEDCAIPVEKLGDFVREVERILSEHGTHAAFYAHASAGCLHIRPIINLKTLEGVQNLRSIAEEVLALTMRIGGAMSSEHGDGLLRSEWLEQTYGKQLVTAMKNLKQAADPDNLLNPKNLVGAPAMDTNLRYGVDYKSQAWTPGMDFERNGGLATAIEQCNGQGVCRKADGVMCPSFQATREEMHSTRGRANLLRAMISIGNSGLQADQVKQALDLCLACKGCKAECPSGVDMAKLKYEFQDHYYKTHRRPLRDYLFGFIGQFARIGAPFAGLLNWIFDRAIIKKIAELTIGISQKRVFPKFGRRKKENKSEKRNRIQREGKFSKITETCLFLPDTFTHFFEPEVEESALNVLAACGIRVHVLTVFGAGRTLLSKGFIEPAKRHTQHLLDEIRRVDPSGSMAIVGLEPSEIYTLRDELIDLHPERKSEVVELSDRAWLIDEYLIRPSTETQKRRISNFPLSKDFCEHKNILLHGHCYQKAQSPKPDGFSVGVKASAELLRHVGYDVEVLETGCCGMAGAFGYEDDHYEVSMKVGELKLFPEIRKANSSGIDFVVAIGTSCRAQILDGTGVGAHHSIKLVADLLRE